MGTWYTIKSIRRLGKNPKAHHINFWRIINTQAHMQAAICKSSTYRGSDSARAQLRVGSQLGGMRVLSRPKVFWSRILVARLFCFTWFQGVYTCLIPYTLVLLLTASHMVLHRAQQSYAITVRYTSGVPGMVFRGNVKTYTCRLLLCDTHAKSIDRVNCKWKVNELAKKP